MPKALNPKEIFFTKLEIFPIPHRSAHNWRKARCAAVLQPPFFIQEQHL